MSTGSELLEQVFDNQIKQAKKLYLAILNGLSKDKLLMLLDTEYEIEDLDIEPEELSKKELIKVILDLYEELTLSETNYTEINKIIAKFMNAL